MNESVYSLKLYNFYEWEQWSQVITLVYEYPFTRTPNFELFGWLWNLNIYPHTPVFTHYTSAMGMYTPHDGGSDKQQ